MIEDSKKLTIIIPVYNVEKYLKECVDSCINQTYKNLEIIVINDGSTDKTLEILKKYEDYAKPLTENDKKRLMQLEKMELPDEERKLITYMLQKGIKLEQECISESQ